MYNKQKIEKTSIQHNDSTEGETIEMKIRRIVNNKEPITDGAPIIYTERKEGVKPEYDIRTDRFELAVEATDKITKQHLAKREERQNKIIEMRAKANEKGNEGGNVGNGNEGTSKDSAN